MIFISTGTSANDLHFQAFLVEGLVRWNRDRELAAITSTDSAPCCYDSELSSAVNHLSEQILGKKLHLTFKGPNKYTGIEQCYDKHIGHFHFVYHLWFSIFFLPFLLPVFVTFCITGELIGVEYLYAQTGQVLQNFSDEQEELVSHTSDVEDTDEGFQVSNYLTSLHGLPWNFLFIIQV